MPMNNRLLRPRQTGFDPRSISGLALWLDAADSGTLFQDAAATIPATATNDPVGAWLDKSGNGRHATQGTGANRPTLGVLGTRNAAAFAGSNSVTVPAYPAKATSTYIYVSRHDDASETIFQTGFTNQFHSHLVEVTSKFRRFEVATSGVVLGSNIGVGTASLWCVDFSNAAASVRYNGATVGSTSTASTTPIADSSLTTTLGRLTPTEPYASLNGRIAEFMVYGGRNLSASETTRLERYLAAKWGITLAPQVSNADAQDWINRVYSNGGTVSATTASAVNQFCVDIENAGIRDRFFRVNLFCGNSDASLAAVRTPLFRGPSLTGTQYGGTTDTNFNFVAGDYAENSGLVGNGTNKRLFTGLARSEIGNSASLHWGVFIHTRATSGFAQYVRCDLSGSSFSYTSIDTRANTNNAAAQNHSATQNGQTSDAAHADRDFLVGCTSGVGANLMRLYINGTPSATGSGTDSSANTARFAVFARFVESTSAYDFHANARIGGYTLGLNLNDSQSASYATIWDTFLRAMGRR